MSNKVFKRNLTILRKIMQKYIKEPTQEQINVFEFDVQNIPKISKKIYSYKQLEHIFVSFNEELKALFATSIARGITPSIL